MKSERESMNHMFSDRLLETNIRKIARGFANFEKNTGTTHPNDNGSLKNVKKLAKRATGKDALTDDLDGDLWQGAVSVGTPANSFTGSSCVVCLVFVLKRLL